MSTTEPHPIHDDLFEKLLTQAANNVTNPEEGFFGPDSILWKVMRFNYPWLIGASRMLILQSIHIWMAQAGSDFSYGFRYPMKRAVNTFMMMSQIIFGDKDTALKTATTIRIIHNQIRGKLNNKHHPFPNDHYQANDANDANALLWVHATLWETTVLTYELIYSPLTQSEKDKLYEELILLGLLFGIPKDVMPKGWEGFMEYNQAMCSSEILSGEGDSKKLAGYFLNELDSTMPRVFAPFFYFLREFTISILPDEVREKLALSYNPKAGKAFLWWIRVVRRVVLIPIPYNGLFVQRKAKLARLKSNKKAPDYYWLLMDSTVMSMLRLTTLVFLSRRKVDDGMSSI
ncbi:MAG: DUF2236 domain-containing protein, partial [Pseudomonadales bacterium]|nr:DUF2236 domain-containing protein [Pseudomonadales bacterium]